MTGVHAYRNKYIKTQAIRLVKGDKVIYIYLVHKERFSLSLLNFERRMSLWISL